MTAEVQERHRRAALRVRRGDDMVASADCTWLTTGERLMAHVTSYKHRMDELDAAAQAIADAEERGRIEERVRCAEAASNVDVTSDWTIRRWRETFSKITCASIEAIEAWEDSDDTIKSLVLDAARKELGE